jgi:MOB kinase activator 1
MYSYLEFDGEHRYEYLWEDGVKFKRPTKLPAPEYVDALMNWAQNLLDDENVFPNKIGALHLN